MGLAELLRMDLGGLLALGLGSLSLRPLVPQRQLRLVLVARLKRCRPCMASCFGRILRFRPGTWVGGSCSTREFSGVVGTQELGWQQSLWKWGCPFSKYRLPWRCTVRRERPVFWSTPKIR